MYTLHEKVSLEVEILIILMNINNATINQIRPVGFNVPSLYLKKKNSSYQNKNKKM